MAYSTYQEFRTAVEMVILGDDVSQNGDGQASLDTMISMGEALVHYGGNFAGDGRRIGPLRASSMEVDLLGEVGGNAAPIPLDCMELSILWLNDGEPLEIVSERDLRSRLKHFNGGKARKAAQAGESIIFSPRAEDGDQLGGRYYAKPPALKDGLHATFQRYPEIYLYAALYVSAPFYGFDGRIPMWQAYYSQLLDQANAQERGRVSSGGRLRQVAR